MSIQRYYSCFECGIEEPDELFHVSPDGGLRVCRDRAMCFRRRTNAEVKSELMKELRVAEHGHPCQICRKLECHGEYHKPVRCTWCKMLVEFVPSATPTNDVGRGMCSVCRESWRLEIEKEMGR